MVNFPDSCINQHGESARAYLDTALALGEMCLLPNVGLDPLVQDVIADLLRGRDRERSGVGDVKVFAKPSGFTGFDKDTIALDNVAELFNFGKQLYPEEMARMEVYDQLDEYWNESKIYRRAKEFNANEFSLWMYKIFAENSELEEPESLDRKSSVERLIELLNPKLFSSSKQNVSLYCTTEDENENTSFAPYFFIGDSCLVIVAKVWVL